jgi:hypothetical protein
MSVSSRSQESESAESSAGMDAGGFVTPVVLDLFGLELGKDPPW